MSMITAVPGRVLNWSTAQSASQRQLVVLIENGGVDLGIPEFVERVISAVPGASSVISDSAKNSIVEALRRALHDVTDNALESAELALQSFNASSPDPFGLVTLLRNSTATLAELRQTLFEATRSGRMVDLLILTHGGPRSIAVNRATGDEVTDTHIRAMAADFGGPLAIRSVYMMNCVGTSLNPAWIAAGARTSAGTHANNYLPEPTTHLFWNSWKSGQSFETAVTSAYRKTIDYMNGLLRELVSAALGPVAGLAASALDISSMAFVRDSRPEVVGNGALTITSENLGPVATDLGLTVTVIPTTAGHARTLSANALPGINRTVSEAGISFILRWELPYETAPETSRESAETSVRRRISAAESFLSQRVAHPLTQHQIDALVCFACGIGASAFKQSRLLAMLENGNFTEVPSELLRWIKVHDGAALRDSEALRLRRAAESELFSGVPFVAPQSRAVQQYSVQQNPLAGIAIADAIQIGLGGAAMIQSAVQGSTGTLTFTWDKQQRLLTPESRLQMPGAQRPRNAYTREFFRFPQIRAGAAYAQFYVDWGGNDYGEIDTPIFRTSLSETSTWSHSAGTMNITAVSRIPSGPDPRAWPLVYHYEASFDPVGNGMWRFQGDFEISAFGGIRFLNPTFTSDSLANFALSVSPENWRGPDVSMSTPTIPQDQLDYLRQHVPS